MIETKPNFAKWHKKGFTVIIVAMFLVSAISGCIGQEEEESVLTMSVRADFITPGDPANAKIHHDMAYAGELIYERLLDYDLNSEIVPSLATKWELVDDLTWRFYLREDVTFHDGTKFDAEAAKISLDRLRDTVGAPILEGITSFEVEDTYKLLVHTEKPLPTVEASLANFVSCIYSPEVINELENPADVVVDGVGTGPYKMVEFMKGDHLSLEAFEDYWNFTPKVDKLIIRIIPEETTALAAFKAHEVDALNSPPPHELKNLKANANYKVTQGPSSRVVGFFFPAYNLTGIENTASETQDIMVRKAIVHSINKETIVHDICEDAVGIANEWLGMTVAPGFRYMNWPGYEYNPDLSKQLLEDAGWVDANGDGIREKDGKDLHISLWCPIGRYLKDKEMAVTAQDMMREVGIDSDIELYDLAKYFGDITNHELGGGKCDMFVIGEGHFPDPDYMARSWFHSEGAWSAIGLNSPEYDELLDKGIGEMDKTKRQQYYKDALKLLADSYLLVPIYHQLETWVVWNNVVGWTSHPMETIVIMEELEVKKLE